MKRLRAVLFITLFLAFLLCVPVTKFVTMAGVDFPEWAHVNKKKSTLEGRSYQTVPELSMETITTVQFQDEAEQYLADLVPARDDILLLNASVQRLGIRSANALFRFDAYPTFYGSDMAYSPSYDALYDVPSKIDVSHYSKYEEAASLYNSFAKRNDQVDVYLCRPMRANALSFGPVADLTSNRVDYEFQSEYFDAKLGDSVTVVDVNPDTYADFYELWFRTDHHWSVRGAYLAYMSLAAELGFSEELLQAQDLVVYQEPSFYGSFARTALTVSVSPDHIVDYRFDLPEYAVEVNGKSKSLESVFGFDDYESGEWSEDLFRSRNAEYFRSDYAELVYTSLEPRGKGSLLLVADSFAKSFDRLFLAHYDRVYVFDPRRNETTLDEYLQAHEDIGDVVFCLSSTFADSGVKAALGDEGSSVEGSVIE